MRSRIPHRYPSRAGLSRNPSFTEAESFNTKTESFITETESFNTETESFNTETGETRRATKNDNSKGVRGRVLSAEPP